ncbi:MAG: hypothetical protein M0R37_11455 [Bacteroidales bacterium]|nr:hypothetical protein [Bacteroidales bacterium]
MKRVATIVLLLILFAVNINAQELSFGGDLFNRYVWRGLDLGGKSPSIQPWMRLDMGNEKHLVSIGAWSAFSLSGTSNDETDLYLSYSYKSTFTATLTDYFFPGLNTGSKDKYFEWGKESTGHILEGTVAFNGTDKIPVTILFSMNLFGNDSRRSNGEIFMSKYIEIGYKTKIYKTDFNAFIGAALDKPDINAGETAFYLNTKPSVTNIGLKLSKEIKLTDHFSVPVQCSLVANPNLNKIYMILGFSI